MIYHQTYKKATVLWSSALSLLLFVACVNENDRDIHRLSGEGECLVSYQLHVPGSSVVPTRQLSAAQESALGSIAALVFGKDGTYSYKATTMNIDAVGGTVSLKMKQSADANDTYQVVFIANADVDDLALAGKTKSEVQALLTYASVGKWDTTTPRNLPMWGQTPLFQVAEGATSFTVQMLRAVARIDLSVAASMTDYELTHLYLYNSRTSGFLIPTANAVSVTATGASVSQTSIPTDAGTNTVAMEYTVTGGASVRDIYVAENDKDGEGGTLPTFLVAGITYGGEETFYRIDLSDMRTNAVEQASDRYDLLRNRNYVVTIENINGSGFATKEDAARSELQNNVGYVVDAEENGAFSDIEVSGKYYFQVLHDALVGGTTGAALKIPFKTNVNGFSDTNLAWDTGYGQNLAFGLADVSQGTDGVTTGNIVVTSTTGNSGTAAIKHLLRITPAPIASFSITINQDKGRARYELTDAVVHGIYLPKMTMGGGQTVEYDLLTDVHYMDVTVKTLANDDLSNYNCVITSNAVNGYQFACNIPFSSLVPTSSDGTYTYYTVPLQGDGTPDKGGYNFFNLTSEGVHLANEESAIRSEYPKQVRVFAGYNNKSIWMNAYFQGTYGYATESGAAQQMLATEANYGPTGTVPSEGFSKTQYRMWTYDLTTSTQAFPYSFVDDLSAAVAGGTMPDIIILGFEYNLLDPALTVLKDYLDAGGVLLLFVDDINHGNTVNNVKLCQLLLTASAITVRNGGSYGTGGGGTAYPFASVSATGSQAPQVPVGATPGDEVLNGPFGNLFGLQWGEDASATAGLTGISATEPIVIYSYGRDRYGTGDVTCFRMKEKGFFYIGDGGFIAQANKRDGGSGNQPFWMSDNGIPIPDTDYNPDAYNSQFFANMMYWAMDYAEFYGPNNHTEGKSYAAWNK
ncbi:MAG: DUF4906 domain-containing protein [Mediterranea sp.]|jgi:hypothetical protein|nr:DUF4906 domain-containing protein [Mediterranea sp.]